MSSSARRQTWKEYAGRSEGSEDYELGDVLRHLYKTLFRSSSAPVGNTNAHVDEEDVSILDLKSQRDQLVGQRRRVEKMVGKDVDLIKTLMAAGNKDKAMLALKRKKLHEQMVLDCGNHVTNLDGLIMNIESARQQREIVHALADGVATMKKIQKEIGGADYVQRLMDEQADLADEMADINEALASSSVTVDDDEALAELQKLEEAAALDALTQKVTPVGAKADAVLFVAPPAASTTSAPAAAEEEPRRELIPA